MKLEEINKKYDLIFSNKLECYKCNLVTSPIFYKRKDDFEHFHAECINIKKKMNENEKMEMKKNIESLNLNQNDDSFDVDKLKEMINDTEIIKEISDNKIKHLGENINNNIIIKDSELKNFKSKRKSNLKFEIEKENNIKINTIKLDKTQKDNENFWKEFNTDYFLLTHYNKIKPSILGSLDLDKYKNDELSLNFYKLLSNDKDEANKINFLYLNKNKKDKNLWVTLDKRNYFDINFNTITFNENNEFKIVENNNDNININNEIDENELEINSNFLEGNNNIFDYRYDYAFFTNYELELLKFFEKYKIDNNDEKNLILDNVIVNFEKYKSNYSNKISDKIGNIKKYIEDEKLYENAKKHYYIKKINKNVLLLLKFNKFINSIILGQKEKNINDYKFKFRIKKKESLVEPDCMICFSGKFSFCNPIIYCSKCNNSFHQNCYLLDKIPNEEFFCDVCLEIENDEKKNEKIKCHICLNSFFTLKKLKNYFYHPICLLSNSLLKYYFLNNIELSHLKRSSVGIVCKICKKSDGLVNTCSNCQKNTFHFLCGYLQGNKTETFLQEKDEIINKVLFQKLNDIKNYDIKSLISLHKDFKKNFMIKLKMKYYCLDCLDSNYNLKQQTYLRKYSINYNKLMLEDQENYLKEYFNLDLKIN